MKIIFLLLILTFHLLILSQLIFTAWPEMFSYPYLFLNGFSLYKDFIMPYPPGLVLLLAGIFGVFGFTPLILKLFTWLIILIIDLLLFLILHKIAPHRYLNLLFLLIFIFWQSFLEGNMFWFDIAALPFLLLAYLFSFQYLEDGKSKSLFFAGLFLSLSVIIKQITIIYLGLFFIFYLLKVRKFIKKDLVNLIGGVLLGLLPFGSWLILTKTLKEFWQWTILYPLMEWSKFPGYVNYLIPKKGLAVSVLLTLPLLVLPQNIRKYLKDWLLLLSLTYFLAAVIAIYPRFSYFHFQPALAFLLILIAVLSRKLSAQSLNYYLVLLVLLTGGIIFLTGAASSGKEIRFYDAKEQEISQKIIQMSNFTKRVYLLGLNSSQYVFTKTLPPDHWSDNFGWYLEIPGVQEWSLAGFKETLPEYIFWRVPDPGPWYALGTYQPKQITEYIRQHYKKTDKIEPNIEIWKKNL